MKKVLQVFAVLVFLAGLVWFLQGINVLLGSPMTGTTTWTINGAIAMAIGGGLFWFARRK
jgi:LPXTG-motif cell wall-anchored protein